MLTKYTGTKKRPLCCRLSFHKWKWVAHRFGKRTFWYRCLRCRVYSDHLYSG